MDKNQLDSTPKPRRGFSCIACKRPNTADNLVACDKCGRWWHYTCAGVSDSISDRDWVCSRCLPFPSPAASVRSTTSSRRVNLQLKRLAEQQELEMKQLELEKKQLELQKKHSQEKFDLEEALVDEDEYRSVGSNEIESRVSEVSAWVDQQTLATRQPVIEPTHPVAELTGSLQPIQSSNNETETEPDGAVGGVGVEASSSQPYPQQNNGQLVPEQPTKSVFQLLQQQLEACQQQADPTVEQLQMLEAQLQNFRIQLHQRNQPVSVTPSAPDTSKGAIPKANGIAPITKKQANPLADRTVGDTISRTDKVPVGVPPEEPYCIRTEYRDPGGSRVHTRSLQTKTTVGQSPIEQPCIYNAPSNRYVMQKISSEQHTHRASFDYLPVEPLPSEQLRTRYAPSSQRPVEPLPSEQLRIRYAPSSQLPVEPLPSEQLRTRYAPSNQLPVEPLPSEQLRTRYAPSSQLPVEPLPSEQLRTRYAPSSQLPVEPLPSEQLRTRYAPSSQLPVEPLPSEQLRIRYAPSNQLPVEPLPFEQLRTRYAPSNQIPVESLPSVQLRTPFTSLNAPVPESVQFGQPRNQYVPLNQYSVPVNIPISEEQPRIYSAHSTVPTTSTNEAIRRPSPEQLAARQVMPRDLPEFTGDPEEWPIFYSSFTNSTAACGFSHVENLARLQRCLKGNALRSVRYYLLSPDSVPDVMETLRTLYGRPEIIINKLIRSVRETPAPKSERLDTLIDFGMCVRNLTQHLIAAGQQAHLVNPALLQELIEKLPANIKLQWAQHLSYNPEASLRNFSDFMSAMVESVSKVVVFAGGQYEKPRTKDKGFMHAHSEDTSSGSPVEEKPEQEKVCLFCGKTGHRLKDCTKFQNLPVDDRWKNVQSLKVCRSCLNPHGRRTCRNSNRCGIDGCEYRHHQLLHGKTEETSTTTSAGGRVEDHAYHHHEQSVLFRIIPVTIYGKSKSITAFAFLDEGSSATLVERSLVEELGVEGPNVPLCLKWTANMTRTEEESQVVSLEVSEIDHKNRFHLVNVRTVECLNLPSQTLRFEELQKNHPHLKGLPVRSYTNATPKLLVGLRNLQLAVPLKIKKGNSGVIAAKTRLGWCVYGSLGEAQTNKEFNYHVCECEAGEKLEQLIKDYFNAEDCGVNRVDIVESAVNERARKIMVETTQRTGSRFETGLLWRTDYVEFPDSFPMALRRLQCLERRMDRDPLLKENIHRQVKEYQEKGFAHLATEDKLANVDPRRTWYLPLGAVCNPKKPGKVRLIWDAAAKVDGISLNSLLLSGPDLLVSFASVLFRFRQYQVAVSGDIKEMFHQVRVSKRDRASQCFLFRSSPDDEPEVYMMDVLTFGASSSPTSAQFVKNQNAQDFADEFPRAADAIKRCHYVDDYLDSFESIDEAKTVSGEVKWIHSQAGFEIRNWSSNKRTVLDHLGEPPKEKTKDLSLQPESERVLGMLWNTGEDNLCFSTTFKEEIAELIKTGTRPTKRQVLRCVMSLFDPLGLLACVLVHGKIIMQNIWRSGIKWDDCVDENIYEAWVKWINLLDEVNEVRIPRCYFQNASAEQYRSLEVHVFVDASEAAYAALVYFRTVNPDGTAKCALVSAKTKVAPLRYVSIPRLELMAAVLGVRLASFVRENHCVKINRVVYWSDSEVTLAWIRSEHRRYRPFVACRVGEILSSTNVNDWRYVPSKLNVADEATKWGDGPCLNATGRWFSGPPFLQLPEGGWPTSKRSITTTDEELRACYLHQDVFIPRSPINYERFSNWHRLLRATAYVIRYGTPRNRNVVGTNLSRPLTHEELKAAEILIWKLVQSEVYPDEIAVLATNKTLPIGEQVTLEKSSPLWRLTPMLDDNGVLRIDGRITAAQGVPEDVKYPVILPRKHRVTSLIIDSYHRKFVHGNSETVVNEIRQRFFVSQLRTAVREVEKRCQRCKVYKAKPATPRMGPLPEARLSPGFRPFRYIGIDYFGPILVKVNRSVAKRWVCLITCLTVRAVHVEVAYDLSTKSCIACIRRFVCRRGSPEEIYSDNGRNFTGADRILKDQIEQIERDAATTFTNTETKWFFIPPSSPHMGGSWERMVRSVKNAMTSMPQDEKLDDEGLLTLVVEAEAIVNSRPLTYLPLHSAEREALTPNHFIMASSTGVGQPAVDIGTSEEIQASWDLVQRRINHFWRRWVLEYLPTLTKRTKWFGEAKPVESGDLVIVIDDGKRNGWMRGRIVEVTAGRDGRIRQALVQTSSGLYRRPVSKLAVLDVDVRSEAEGCTLPHGEGDVVTTVAPATLTEG